MHEMALAEGVLEIVEDTARQQRAARVATVWLELGALSHVEREALALLLRRGDARQRRRQARGSRSPRRPAPRGACGAANACRSRGCGDACPRCGGYQLEVVAGDEMRVKEIEVA